MAKIHQLIRFISKWEGNYVNDPSDPGGATNKGVTLTTWKNTGYDKDDDGDIDIDDLKLITHEDMIEVVLRPHYWDLWKADKIINQSIANLVVDWTWCSGVAAIKSVQRILGVEVDGIVGNQTLFAINRYRHPAQLFSLIKAERICYIMNLCEKKPALKRFQKGWLNRIASLNFASLLVITMLTLLLPSCRTMASHPSRTVAISTHEVVNEQATTLQETAQTAVITDQQLQVCQTDSLAETLLMTFSYPMEKEANDSTMPLLIKGCAILSRVSKIKHQNITTLATAIASNTQQSTINSSLVRATDSLSVVQQIAPARKTTSGTPLVVLLLFLLCLFIIAYLLSNYMRGKSD